MDSAEDVLPASLANVLEANSLKWVFVGGKGGVGKTTCSCRCHFRRSSILTPLPARRPCNVFCRLYLPPLEAAISSLWGCLTEAGALVALQCSWLAAGGRCSSYPPTQHTTSAMRSGKSSQKPPLLSTDLKICTLWCVALSPSSDAFAPKKQAEPLLMLLLFMLCRRSTRK